jgi:hypothetical protein
MDMGTPLGPISKHDPQVVKRWAAEHFAISIGLLRECPYHGQPLKVRKPLEARALATAYVDPHDPLVKPFNGNARELYVAAERVSAGYSECCALCAASEQQELD